VYYGAVFKAKKENSGKVPAVSSRIQKGRTMITNLHRHSSILRSSLRRIAFALVLICALTMATSLSAQTFTVLHNFTGCSPTGARQFTKIDHSFVLEEPRGRQGSDSLSE